MVALSSEVITLRELEFPGSYGVRILGYAEFRCQSKDLEMDTKLTKTVSLRNCEGGPTQNSSIAGVICPKLSPR